MFDYKISKHPHFEEACRAFALRHNMAKLAERAGMNVQTLRNKLNPDQPHQLTPPEIWLLTDLTEDSTLVDGFLAQIHCLPCVPMNEVAKEKLPHYVMSATAEIGRVAAGAVTGDVKTTAGRRDVISSINSVTRLMALAAVSMQARLQANPAMASAVDTVTGLGASFGIIRRPSDHCVQQRHPPDSFILSKIHPSPHQCKTQHWRCCGRREKGRRTDCCTETESMGWL